MPRARLSALLSACLLIAATAMAGCAGGGSDQPQCQDGVDNDGDGLIDGDDPACQRGRDVESDDPITDCNNGEDDDGDGLVDLDDPGCANIGDDSELDTPVPQCDDGIDNDGDGKIDYPADPGCFSPLQASEDDDCPDGPNCPECGDGVDNDGDGAIDYPADSGCASASDSLERTADPTACAGIDYQPLTGNGVTSGVIVPADSQTLSGTCGGPGHEQVYELTIERPQVLVATTALSGTVIDTVLYVRERCGEPSTEHGCNDNATAGAVGSSLTVALDPGYYYLVVDGASVATLGAYQLQVTFYPGAGTSCDGGEACAPGLVCRTLPGGTGKTCEQPVCSDGRDDDGDGVADYPGDPGCASPADDSEADDCPDGPTCPACSNHQDDDGDGQVDYPADPDCASAGQTVEGCGAEQDPIQTVTGPTLSGSTAAAHDDFDPTCGSSGGLDVAHFLTVPVALQSLTVDTIGSAFDTLVYVGDAACDGTYLGCNDDGGGSATSALTLSDVAPGSYAVFVDGYSSGDDGAYRLNVHGIAKPSEACTDPLFAAGVLACPTGYPCDGAICAPPACGNTIDEDGDGFAGFPDDPGCTSALDPDETDDCPDGPNCPACGNHVDDDGDGLADYPADPNCLAASTDSEACPDSDALHAITLPTHTDTTAGATNDYAATCVSSPGPDHVWTLDLPVPVSSLRVDTAGTAWDTVLMLKTAACGATDLACNDQGTGLGNQSLITATNLAAGGYVVIVDGYTTSASGPYTLNVHGVTVPDAACTSPLFASGVLSCPTGYGCDGATCVAAACNDQIDQDGDGKVGYPSDPGCTSIDDLDESDDCPDGPNCPRCGNHLDDDHDGQADFPLDPGCPSASTDDESGCATATDPFAAITGPVTTGNLDTEGNDLAVSCLTPTGRDLAYLLEVPFPLASLSVDTNGSALNTAIAVRADDCSTADLACDDNSGTDHADSYLVLTDVAAGRYVVVLDSASATSGAYTLDVHGVIAEGAACDPALDASGLFRCVASAYCGGTPGAETCLPLACANGLDDDGDGKIDAMDPGCLSQGDDSEVDPATLPACANGGDDDGDGLADYPDDNGCRNAADPLELLCAESSGLPELTVARTAGSTAGAGDNFTPGCATNSAAPERAYQVTIPGAMTSLTFDVSYAVTSGAYNRVIYVRRDDCTTDVACSDSPEKVTLSNAAAGTYFVFVDGAGTAEGSYVLGVSGTIAAGAACDPLQIQAGMFACAGGLACVDNVCQ
ncbi:MAG: hypothetical protein H6708_26020 [Kofleriaceae bacterium]|nr:hypothetical protein [Kofleriaceae bacterium]